MNNLTKRLKAKAKKLSDPIMDELKEQYELTQFNKSMIRFREKSELQFSNKSLIFNS